METTDAGTNGSPRRGLRERLKATEPPTLPPETLERLSNLPASLSETARSITEDLEESAERILWKIQGTMNDAIQSNEQLASALAKRLTEQTRVLEETERNVAHTVERLRRVADRTGWIQTGVILLALAAGTLGGMAAALLILGWIG
jgi:hypothetical protein